MSAIQSKRQEEGSFSFIFSFIFITFFGGPNAAPRHHHLHIFYQVEKSDSPIVFLGGGVHPFPSSSPSLPPTATPNIPSPSKYLNPRLPVGLKHRVVLFKFGNQVIHLLYPAYL